MFPDSLHKRNDVKRVTEDGGVALTDKMPLSKLVTPVCSIAALDIVLAAIPLIPYGLQQLL
jgi:hypothetical protein